MSIRIGTGNTEEVVLPILEEPGRRCPAEPCTTGGGEVAEGSERDSDLILTFSPERGDSGNKQFKTHQVSAASMQQVRAPRGSVETRSCAAKFWSASIRWW